MSKMRIGVDARRLATHNRGGVTAVLRNLVSGLEEHRETVELVFYYAGIDERWRSLGIESFTAKFMVDFVHKQFILPSQLRRDKIDVLFCPAQPIPVVVPVPVVVIIHDVGRDFENRGLIPAAVRYLILPVTAARATVIVTDSFSSKRDIIAKLGASADRVRVIYPGVNSLEFYRDSDNLELARIRQKHSLQEYVLLSVVGAIASPRKNVETLLLAYERLADGLRQATSLIIVGDNAHWQELRRQLKGRVRVETLESTVVISNLESLRCYYTLADVYVHASLHEGFGLPVLEAMACGTPVVSSNAASLPEVVGDAGILVSPLDADAFSTAIARLLTDNSLRSELAQRGLSRAAQFSVRRYTAEFLEVFRSCVG